MDPLFPIRPEDFAALSADDLNAFIADSQHRAEEIAADPGAFVNEDRTVAQLRDEVAAGIEALEAAREALAVAESDEEPEPDDKPEAAEAEADEFANDDDALDAVAELAAEALADDGSVPGEDHVHDANAPVAKAGKKKGMGKASVTASGRQPLPRPSQSRASVPQEKPEEQLVALTAAAPNLGVDVGEAIPSPIELAKMMERRRSQFGVIPDGTMGEKITIARVDYSSRYPDDRRVGTNAATALERIQEATDPDTIIQNFNARRDFANKAIKDGDPRKALTASGGLCAPVTPYYQLAMVSVAERPVRGALPSFNADRGGLRYAQPATLASITTGVGTMTVSQDAAGGTTSQKSCQTVDCPAFVETDVITIYHCLQFGNLGARTFPERVAQWNELTLAAHARKAETLLLDGIAASSKAVVANNSMNLGASAQLFSQMLVAGDAMRSRHRMNPDTVLRALFPFWVLDLLVSDVIRGQFDRWEFAKAEAISKIREMNIEPSFYLDQPTSGAQVFGTQNNGVLLTFPGTVIWYLFPEGSFIYLDGGVLELGLVRDSVLNKTNDFQIFGESFENVAFVGVESYQVTTHVDDNGSVALPVNNHSVAYS